MSSCRKFAIMKWVNYRDGSMQNLAKKLDYIANPKSSPPEYRMGYFIDALYPLEGLETIHQRYCPVGKRNFKHGMFSFGVSDISAEVAFAVSQQLVARYSKTYPVLLCLHTNIPTRIHAHFIMDTCSVLDGKKFSQSPAEFEEYRRYFNAVMRENNLPMLKNAAIEVIKDDEGKNAGRIRDEDSSNMRACHTSYVCQSFQSNVPIFHSPLVIRQPQLNRSRSFRFEFNCDVDKIKNNIIAGVTELTTLVKKQGGK